MATYFLFGAIGQCPACGDHRFSGPPVLAPDASVTATSAGTRAAWRRPWSPRSSRAW